MLSKGRPLDTSSSLLSPCPSLLFPDHNSGVNVAWESQSSRADISARTRAYPSPPMSGAPTVSPNDPRELYKQSRGSSGYSTEGIHDVYTQKRPLDIRLQLPPPQAPMPPVIFPGPYPGRSAVMDRPYSYLGSDAHSNHPSLYSFHEPQHGHELKSGHTPQHFPVVSSVGNSRTGAELRQSGTSTPSDRHQAVDSPKAQRKTKGHVASACVPCKRAHLRCDAQRPCSRCISNGKEDSCVDVQHKKRGRPRLRDDREARFDSMRQTPGQSRDVSPRRPADIHPSIGPGSYDDHYQRYHQQFRGVDFAASGGSFSSARTGDPSSISSADLNGYYSLSNAPGSSEPVAYLDMNLDFLKGSPTFWDTLGLPSMAGRNLGQVLLPSEHGKVSAMHSYLNHEQRQREPNYLPPILSRGSESIHGLGFTMEDFGRFPLGVRDHLVFLVGGSSGFPRPMPVRAGLAKEGSFYFVVLLLSLPPRQTPRHHHHQHHHQQQQQQHHHQRRQQQQQHTPVPPPPPVANGQGAQAESSYPRMSPGPGTMFAQRGPGSFDSIKVRRGETDHAAGSVPREHPSSGQSCRAPNAGDYGIDHPAAAAAAAQRPPLYHGATPDHNKQMVDPALQPHGFPKEPSPPTRPPPHTTSSSFQLPPIRPQMDRMSSLGAPTIGGGYGAGERPKRLAIDGLLGNSDEPVKSYDHGRRWT
ncbi:hypothetical protein E4U57_001663 [Claviceps arundinis]|uniref:Zn(2)-C6 fungal-type domain-containing protein n=1 Tax=Claviceps arundinis TaxID=1623583 RepID=A0ABQ7PAI5_9HYPO|nr:hypothetical protein E4U57_001663 [Claviceps arundinis]